MITLILNHDPYDGSDITYNALRLAKSLHKSSEVVNIFLMNDAVALARSICIKPEIYDFDLHDMVKNLYEHGVSVRACGTCNARCGMYKNTPYFSEEINSSMEQLTQWVIESKHVLTF
ncbi:MAG: DsrE family protein [Sulfuricurvum sp.]|nr:DsrE family protein [Sulfuricurvum sp.]